MPKIVVTLIFFAVCSASCFAQNQKITPRDRFLKLNPNYLQRAGNFYEKKYLPGAVKSMVRGVKQQRLSKAKAEQILRTFIYEWLQAYIDDGGAITRTARDNVIQRTDKRVQDLLKDNRAYLRYLRWRRDPSQVSNPLAFLFHQPVLTKQIEE